MNSLITIDTDKIPGGDTEYKLIAIYADRDPKDEDRVVVAHQRLTIKGTSASGVLIDLGGGGTIASHSSGAPLFADTKINELVGILSINGKTIRAGSNTDTETCQKRKGDALLIPYHHAMDVVEHFMGPKQRFRRELDEVGATVYGAIQLLRLMADERINDLAVAVSDQEATLSARKQAIEFLISLAEWEKQQEGRSNALLSEHARLAVVDVLGASLKMNQEDDARISRDIVERLYEGRFGSKKIAEEKILAVLAGTERASEVATLQIFGLMEKYITNCKAFAIEWLQSKKLTTLRIVQLGDMASQTYQRIVNRGVPPECQAKSRLNPKTSIW
jgi:hypothetical protein